MNFEQIASLVAILISFAALGVGFYNAMLNRPRLRLRTSAPIKIVGDGVNEGPYFTLTIYNIGTQPTTITGTGASWYPKFIEWVKRNGKHVVFAGGGFSTQLPKKLEPGEQAQIFVNITPEVKRDFGKAFRLNVFVSHTWSNKGKRYIVPKSIQSGVCDAELDG